MTKFSDLELDPKVLQAVTEAGYESPTPIQAQAIPHALQGRDVLGIAQTGTGKTASFTLPMISMLAKGRARARMPRSLVLAPTRELAAQVAENFEIYSKHLKLSMALLIGGTSFKDQDRLIDRGVDVLIATPGRLLDHFERGKLMLTGVQIMVVDEADRMLDMGFIPDIERIFKLTPFTRQTLFFSATMAPEITRITQEFLSNPERVEVARQATTSETIEQFVCKHKPSRRDRADKEKRELLRALIEGEGEGLTNGIIFCNRKRDVDIVAKSLKKHGFDAGPIHGDLDQSIRTRTLEGFRSGELRLLIASDVAARGLDIPSVSHVFNYDVPTHSEDYVHRIGRTGRAGREGRAITLCLPHEEKYLDQIQDLVKKEIPVKESPIAKSAPAEQPKEAPEAETAPEPAEKPRSRSRSRGGRSNGEGGRGRREARNTIVGMGEHVPAFLMQSFDVEDLMAATNATTNSAEEDAPIEENAEAQPEEPKAEKPKRRTRKAKEKPAQDDSAEQAQDSEAAAPEAPAEEAPTQEAPVEEAPKPKRKRARKKAPAKAEETPAQETPAQETPAQETVAETPPAEEAQPEGEPASAEAPAAEKSTSAKKPRKRAKAASVIDDIAEAS